MYRSTNPVRELGAVDADAEAIGHLGEGQQVTAGGGLDCRLNGALSE
jgi:hypothetical protein